MNRSLLAIFFSLVLVVSTQRTESPNKIECYMTTDSSLMDKCEGLYCYKKVSTINKKETVKLGCLGGSDKLLPKIGNCTDTFDERFQAHTRLCVCAEHRCNASSTVSFKFALTLLSMLFLTHQWFNC